MKKTDAQQTKLIEFRRKKRNLRDVIPAMWRACTDAKGKVDAEALLEKVAKTIRETDVPYEYEIARILVDQVDRAMRPKRSTDEQGAFSFYDADAYIPIGKSQRRLMSMADKEDIVAWQEIERVEFDASRVAYEEKTAWRFAIISTWRADEKTLADVEKRLAAEKAEAERLKGSVAKA